MSIMSFSEDTYFQQHFTGLSLADETVKSITFEECVLGNCNFINVKFENCRFLNCKFTDCTLSAVVPMNSRLDGVSFKNCKTIGVDWTRTQQFRDISFKDSQLNYSNFRLLKIPRIKMVSCEVKDADFTETDLTLGDFKKSDFEKTRFFKTNLTNADFKEARNYFIDPGNNTLKKTRFSYPEVLTLLQGLDIIIE
jgi:fluoroquinolone resistance protein